jgi:hypothetical protein
MFGVVQLMPWGCQHHLWGEELEPLLILNHKRRMFGGLLDHVANAETAEERRMEMTLAMEAMGGDTLNEFIRRNEWNLQDHVKDYGLDE